MSTILQFKENFLKDINGSNDEIETCTIDYTEVFYQC